MTEKIGFVVVYRIPDDKEKFDERYQKHLKLFEENAAKFVESASVIKVISDDTDRGLYQIATVYLKKGIDLNTAMNSPEMKILVDDVLDFVPEDKFKVFPISEKVY